MVITLSFHFDEAVEYLSSLANNFEDLTIGLLRIFKLELGYLLNHPAAGVKVASSPTDNPLQPSLSVFSIPKHPPN